MNTAALLAIIAIAEVEAGIPRGILQAICTVESNLNPDVVAENDGKPGHASIGLCQVQVPTAQRFRPGVTAKELRDPTINASVAAAYLRFQFARYQRWDRAIVAYNRGSSTGGLNSYHRKVTKEWMKYGRDQEHQGRADSGHSGREGYAARSGKFLREDYAYATEDGSHL